MKLNLQRLSYSKIGSIADEFLTKYNPSFSLPIPIEEIAEGKLNIEIIPIKGLRQKHDKVSGEVLSRRLGKEGIIKTDGSP